MSTVGAFITLIFLANDVRTPGSHVVVVPHFGFVMEVPQNSFGWQVWDEIIGVHHPKRFSHQGIQSIRIIDVPDPGLAKSDQEKFIRGSVTQFR